ncbi:expressed unknown protein [Seminavis robusta]|uniref:Uncharacterized protein n=1 Tax=Seminavis robusta TaxID=568900 RepID=A0A9N8HKC2_9STRA|nr:expressed unknown protein [Seminavis robusta]|eukprot:Sro827_g207780.1 n/a (78) ;mRNA; r:11187-11420
MAEEESDLQDNDYPTRSGKRPRLSDFDLTIVLHWDDEAQMKRSFRSFTNKEYPSYVQSYSWSMSKLSNSVDNMLESE